MSKMTENNSKLHECACRNLRMTTRVITQYYDKALQPAGIKSAQYSLLNDISVKEEGISVNELAEHAMMDQTTVTRNIELLRRNGLVKVEIEEKDSRKKRITVSTDGKAVLAAALPLWKVAQAELEQTVGREEYENFLKTLSVLKKMK
ncbi:MarR family winged helix-turn-helix transcriptional regulator [Anaerocolumna sp. AGMB13020]|uniref:MarR family winged helix-turn-helix transcriptional regulator n=1 Tax=Anaerocolumna sp. AGMB13020 TaxID=3081750 RepID=UPI0029530944|nr:MarR family winged helix-turn-helix transcriptional regulator [Anaerocolumna sp. AGMB13020]WOO36336.1 MarR family winged helix-turn-helix transcriptional regulator [Anaerocolumna sp. AGMB13020]